MNKFKFFASAAALTVAGFLAAPAEAGMTPVQGFASPAIQHVDCAVGFHLGPAGACIIGTPDTTEHRVIEERRATDEGCETRTVQRTDDMGNTETRTRSNCN